MAGIEARSNIGRPEDFQPMFFKQPTRHCRGSNESQMFFTDVVIGILGDGHLTDRAYSSWVPTLRNGSVYCLADACSHALISLSLYHHRTLHDQFAPQVHVECTAEIRVPLAATCGQKGIEWLSLQGPNRTHCLWVKTRAFLHGMWEAFPQRMWYLKVDEDTLFLPVGLSRFLGALRQRMSISQLHRPLYFGQALAFGKSRSDTIAAAIARGRSFAAVEKNVLVLQAAFLSPSSLPTNKGNISLHYAQGGAYGFNFAALYMLLHPVGGISPMLSAVDWHLRTWPGEPVWEDQAVGLSLLVQGVRLLDSPCFMGQPPGCRPALVKQNSSECRMSCCWPVGIHGLKNIIHLNAWVEAARQLQMLPPGERVKLYLHGRG